MVFTKTNARMKMEVFLMSLTIDSKINNVFIHVSNLKYSATWYATLMGLTIDQEKIQSPVFNLPVTGETGLTLDDHTKDPSFVFKPASHAMFNLYTRDIDKAYQFVISNDIKIVKEIEWVGDLAYFLIADPDENVLMLCNK